MMTRKTYDLVITWTGRFRLLALSFGVFYGILLVLMGRTGLGLFFFFSTLIWWNLTNALDRWFKESDPG